MTAAELDRPADWRPDGPRRRRPDVTRFDPAHPRRLPAPPAPAAVALVLDLIDGEENRCQ